MSNFWWRFRNRSRPIKTQNEPYRRLAVNVAPHRALADAVSAITLKHDPVGLDYKTNTEEYDLEAETVVLRLAKRNFNVYHHDLTKILDEEFTDWFGEINIG